MQRKPTLKSRTLPLSEKEVRLVNRAVYAYAITAFLIAACLTNSANACDLCGFEKCWFEDINRFSASDHQAETGTTAHQAETGTTALGNNADGLNQTSMTIRDAAQNETTKTIESGTAMLLWPDSASDAQVCSIDLHENGTLEVIGSNESDWLEVNLMGRFVIVTAVHGIDDPRAFQFNRIDKGFALSDVQQIIMRGKAGDDILVNVGWLPCHQFGDDGNDELNGGSGQDIMHGGRGDDDIHGLDGPDYLLGGPGNDLLDGAKDFEIVKSGHSSMWEYYPVTDYLQGGSGHDLFINYKKTAPGTGFSYPTGTMQDVILDFNSIQDMQVQR